MSLDAEERAILDEILTAVLALKQPPVSRPAGDDAAVASDTELDGEWGDPVLKKSPPRWKGRDLASKRYSQLTEEELDCVIGFLEWKRDKNREEVAAAVKSGDAAAQAKAEKGVMYAVKDAARARGWLRRLKQGWKPPTVSDEIPF